MLGYVSDFLGSVLTPAVLLTASLILLPYVSRRGIRNRSKKKISCSQWRAMSIALAGTLGVGNITGVASAVICGGAGAVFWMWISSVLVISVKYAEVYLAVLYRRLGREGWFGGAMYYIRDGISRILGDGTATVCAALFAVLCVINSLITGNIVQANAAAGVLPDEFRFFSGLLLSVLVLLSIIHGTRRIEKITSAVIPPIAVFYMAVCICVIACNFRLLPKILADIFSSAFTGQAVYGGAMGFAVRDGIRYGTMRGIFSNEAGCGTSPSAHASADTDSPHSQAMCGVFEVVFDTLILCTISAFVLLIADMRFALIPWHSSEDTSDVMLSAIQALAGNAVYIGICVSIILFAYATIIAQIYYGISAINYLGNQKLLRLFFYILSVTCPLIGAVISSESMWSAADCIIGTMTCINCIVLILLRKDCRR